MVGGEDTVWADVTSWSLVLFLKLVQVGPMIASHCYFLWGIGWLWEGCCCLVVGIVVSRGVARDMGLGPRTRKAGLSSWELRLSPCLPVGACGASGKGSECQRDLWRLQLSVFTFLISCFV